MKKNSSLLIYFLLAFLFTQTLSAAEKAIIIDGNLNEEFWSDSKRYSDFKTMQPTYGNFSTNKTEVFLKQVNNSLYVAFNCNDTEPDKIRAVMSDRDNILNNDWVSIEIDLFNTGESSIYLKVNPLGVQEDGTYDQSGSEDMSLDMVWESAALVHSEGYTVEMSLPFDNLRFPNEESFMMGLSFRRCINHTSEILSYPEFNPAKGSRLKQNDVFEIRNLKFSIQVNVIPSLVMSYNETKHEGNWQYKKDLADFGLNTKVGISPELIIEATYNPDFSQVESDVGKVDINLRNSIYYPEKRQFFQEGLENFALAGNSIGYLNPLGSIVNTRNIVDPVAGVKLNGKISSANSISAIFAVDEYRQDYPDINSNTAFSIVRLKHNYQKNDYIGGFITSRETGVYGNRVAGLDATYHFNNGARMGVHSIVTQTKDPEGKTKYGSSLGVNYVYANPSVSLNTSVQSVSNNFQTDVGYVERSGILQTALFLTQHNYFQSSFINRISILANTENSFDYPSDKYETWNYLGLELHFLNQSWLWFGGKYVTEIFKNISFIKHDIAGGLYLQLSNEFYLQLNAAYGYRIYYNPQSPGQGAGNEINGKIVITPSQNINASFGVVYSDFIIEDESYSYHYLILRNNTTFQFNQYLFARAIIEYNNYYKELTSNFVLSFTYIPGTVVQLGYGSSYNKNEWHNGRNVLTDSFHNTGTGLFFKASYNYSL